MIGASFLHTLILFFSNLASGSPVTTLSMAQDTVATVAISYQGAVLNFPTKPQKVIIGNQGAFTVDYIGNDVVIVPATSVSVTNVFVYLEGRRFNINAVAKKEGFTLIQIRDKISQKMEAVYEK